MADDDLADLVRFLRDRLDEEAAEAAKLADVDDWEMEPWQIRRDETGTWDSYAYLRVAKARVLAEVDAKRRMLALHGPAVLRAGGGAAYFDTARVCRSCEPPRQFPETAWPCPTLRLLALPYAAHPDYNEAWRP